jgi:predicted ABC-type ATPase
MEQPRFIFVAGCNAAGKSSFIRTRINHLSDFEIIMTDVYKARSREVCQDAIKKGQDIILETPFNVESFKELIDLAISYGYYTSLIVLFLDNPQQSIDRVANRVIEQNGLYISGNNIKWNFSESFKNLANYFFYFDKSDFIYTGVINENKLIMSFRKNELFAYYQNELEYPPKFAHFSYNWKRMNEEAYKLIMANQDYENPQKTRNPSNDLNYRGGYGY